MTDTDFVGTPLSRTTLTRLGGRKETAQPGRGGYAGPRLGQVHTTLGGTENKTPVFDIFDDVILATVTVPGPTRRPHRILEHASVAYVTHEEYGGSRLYEGCGRKCGGAYWRLPHAEGVHMSRHNHLTERARRTVAALATLAITGAATIAIAPTASADVNDGKVNVGPVSMTLTTDANANGRPDVGDVVTLSATVTALDRDIRVREVTPSAVEALISTNTDVAITAGNSAVVSVERTVTALDLGYLGSGPNYPEIYVRYSYSGQVFGFPVTSTGTVTAPGPAPLYAAGDPLSVSTSYVVSEFSSVIDGAPTEGDTVVLESTFTNTSGYPVRIYNAAGYNGPQSEVVSSWVMLAPGEAATFASDPYMVTLGDVVAGYVSFPVASVTWSSGFTEIALIWSGTQSVPFGGIATEALNATSVASVTTELNDALGNPVALGAAQPGDVIDYTFGVTNTGNVVLNHVLLSTTAAWPGGASGAGSTDAQLAQGAVLPSGNIPVYLMTSIDDGIHNAYALTADDVARGYVDLGWEVQAAPSSAMFAANPGAYTHDISKRVFLKTFTMDSSLTYTSATLNDSNGDGIGQEGEDIYFQVQLVNDADQSFTITDAFDVVGSDTTGDYTAAIGQTVHPASSRAFGWTHTITAADQLRGSVDAASTIEFEGVVDGQTKSLTAVAPSVATGEYVAPPSFVNTSATYVDSNGDGFPSIGEVVTVTVTVQNAGTYPLTGAAVADAPGSDITGLLPAISSTIAGPSTAAVTFDYTITNADYLRGSIFYSTILTADGMAGSLSATSVYLQDITFEPYATDLDGVLPGGITVCNADGTPTDTVVIGTDITVVPGNSCTYPGLADGYHVVGFSTPLVLGVDTFAVRVPGQLGVGQHRIALYAASGLVGYQNVTVKDPVAFAAGGWAVLASTGTERSEITGLAGVAAALVLLGTGAIVVSTRRRGEIA